MKIFTLFILIAGGLIWASIAMNGDFSAQKEFLQKCQNAGGFVTQVQIGLITDRLTCSVISINDNKI